MRYLWDGTSLVFAIKLGSPRVRSLAEPPLVAMTIDTDTFRPEMPLVRGEPTLESVAGRPDQYSESSRRFVGEDQMEAWEASARRETGGMVLSTIVPDCGSR